MPTIDMEELIEELMQCRRCGICRNAVYDDMGFDGVCPIWRNSTGFEPDFMRGKIIIALALLSGELEKTAENVKALFQCTLCGNCTEICAASFDPKEAMETVRYVLNDAPNPVRDTLAKRVIDTNTPYEEGQEIKQNWLNELDFEVPNQSDVVYFVGCTAATKLHQIPIATAKILQAANVEFAVMENEPCCGSVLLRTGRADEAEENALTVAESIKSTGAKRVVVSCAGCLKTLRKDYAEKFGIEMPEIVHIVEFAQKLIESGDLNLKPLENSTKVTYHDPCHMGRELNVYDAPRSILESIPNLELVEMHPNRAQALCCGAGGGLRSYDSELAKKIAAERVRHAETLDVSALTSACPFCELNFVSGSKKEESEIEVLDIVELLSRCL